MITHNNPKYAMFCEVLAAGAPAQSQTSKKHSNKFFSFPIRGKYVLDKRRSMD